MVLENIEHKLESNNEKHYNLFESINMKLGGDCI